MNTGSSSGGPNQVSDGPVMDLWRVPPRLLPSSGAIAARANGGRGGGGGGKPQRDLRGIAGPCPLPARTANKEKAAVLVTSVPPSRPLLAASRGSLEEESMMPATLGSVSMAGGAGAP